VFTGVFLPSSDSPLRLCERLATFAVRSASIFHLDDLVSCGAVFNLELRRAATAAPSGMFPRECASEPPLPDPASSAASDRSVMVAALVVPQCVHAAGLVNWS
jgi:hypothetical protein